MRKPPSDTADKVLLRLPEGRRDELKARAKAGYRSLNNEILMLIDRGLQAEQSASGQP